MKLGKPIIKGKIGGKFGAEQLQKAFNQAAITPLEQIAARVVRSAKRSMKKGVKGDPSKPGKPPHVITGRLRGSVNWAKVKENRIRIKPDMIIVGATSYGWYGKVHEWGGKYHPPRPFMRPALKNVKRTMTRRFNKLPLLWTPAGEQLNREMKAIAERGSGQWRKA